MKKQFLIWFNTVKAIIKSQVSSNFQFKKMSGRPYAVFLALRDGADVNNLFFLVRSHAFSKDVTVYDLNVPKNTSLLSMYFWKGVHNNQEQIDTSPIIIVDILRKAEYSLDDGKVVDLRNENKFLDINDYSTILSIDEAFFNDLDDGDLIVGITADSYQTAAVRQISTGVLSDYKAFQFGLNENGQNGDPYLFPIIFRQQEQLSIEEISNQRLIMHVLNSEMIMDYFSG